MRRAWHTMRCHHPTPSRFIHVLTWAPDSVAYTKAQSHLQLQQPEFTVQGWFCKEIRMCFLSMRSVFRPGFLVNLDIIDKLVVRMICLHLIYFLFKKKRQNHRRLIKEHVLSQLLVFF